MQHTVIAFFDTYPQAEAAREALVAAGIAREDVVLKARCEPTYASDATPAAGSEPAANEGLLASIERFFESLFVTAPPEREAAQYAEAVRRGAVMICVDAPTDLLAQRTRTTLEAMRPLDIEERAATWRAPIDADEVNRSHSPLEELGLRPSVPVPPSRAGTVRTYARESAGAPPSPASTGAAASPAAHAEQEGADRTAAERVKTEAAATAVAAGSAPGMGAIFTSGRSEPRTSPERSSADSPTGSPPPAADE
jgi:hypothetical protein